MTASRIPLIANNVVVNVIMADRDVDPMPDGYIIGPEGGDIGDGWDGASYIKPQPDPIPPPPDPGPPTVADVVAERTRRLALGFDYNFNDVRGVHRIGTTTADMAGWDEVTTIANAAINLSLPNTVINVVTDTGPATITALEWQSILIAAAAFRQPLWAKSFLLQAMDPIPDDYDSDVYWS